MLRKLLLLGVVLTVAAMSLMLFAGQYVEAAEKKALYWIGKTLNNSWWIMVRDIAAREAAELGVEITTNLPDEEVDMERQVMMIEAAIQKNVNAIIISAINSQGVIPSLEKAKKAGITIINFDTRIAEPGLAKVFVGADDVAGAYKAGKYICHKLQGKGEVALLEGLLEQSTGVDRKAGFLKAMKECPEIKVVASVSAEWRTDLARYATANILVAHPNIQGMFACNDQMAIGMVEGVKAAGKDSKDLVLVGYDGILEAAQLLLEGELDAFVALPTREEGQMGVRLAVASMLNPTFTFPREIILPGPLVTKTYEQGQTDETIDEYLARVYPLMGETPTGY